MFRINKQIHRASRAELDTRHERKHAGYRSQGSLKPFGLQQEFAQSAAKLSSPTGDQMTLADLLKQKADLERQIASAQSESKSKAIADVRALMAKHGLTAADLVAPSRKTGKAEGAVRRPVAAKYKDDQGNAWTGRGLKPKWLTAALAAGRKIEDFAV